MKRSVNTVITNRAGLLLLQMRDGNPGICHPLQWNFFGGGLATGEEPVSGGRRELQEEIGVEAPPDSFVVLGTITDEQQSVTVVKCLLTIEKQQIQLNEGAGFGYFTLKDLESIDATPMTRLIVQRLLSAPAVRGA